MATWLIYVGKKFEDFDIKTIRYDNHTEEHFRQKERKREWGRGGRLGWVRFPLFIGIDMTYARTLPRLSHTYLSIYDWQDLFLYSFIVTSSLALLFQPPITLGISKSCLWKNKTPPAASIEQKSYSSPPLALSVSAYPQAHWKIWRKDQTVFSCYSHRPLLVFW